MTRRSARGGSTRYLFRARRALFALALAVAAVSVGCGGDSVEPPAPGPAPSAPTAPASSNAPALPPGAAKPAEAASVPAGAGTVLRIVPVLEDTAIPIGTGSVTVTKWGSGPEGVHYTFPAVIWSTIPKDQLPRYEGVTRLADAAGDISVAAGGETADAFVPPMFWHGGAAESPGPLLWLPKSSFEALHGGREATVRIAPLPGGIRMAAEPAKAVKPVTLKVVSHGSIDLKVNGQSVKLPVITAAGDDGSYFTVLDAPENPLVVRFRLGQESVVDGKVLPTAYRSGYDVTEVRKAP